jgi:MFS transporter, DHA1 family, inner membrane transport protein
LTATDHTTLAALFAVLFLAVADNQVLSPLLPLISSELGTSIEWLGQLVTGYALSAGLVAVSLGPWSDRLGRPLLIRWALLLFAAGSLACFLAKDFAGLLLGRLAVGAASGTISFNVIALVGDRYQYKERGRAMGIVYSAYFAALVAGVPAGSWVAEFFGWRAAFAGAAIMALGGYAAAVLTMGLTGNRPKEGDRSEKKAEWTGSWPELMISFVRQRPTRQGLLTSFLVSGGMVCFLTYLGAWLSRKQGMRASEIGALFMILGLAALISSPICGYLSDRIGKARAFVLGNSMAAVAMLALPWQMPQFLRIALFFILSLAAAMRQSPLEALITELAPGKTRGRYIAFRNLCSQLGIATAVLLGGMLYRHLDYVAVAVWAGLWTAAASFSRPEIGEST